MKNAQLLARFIGEARDLLQGTSSGLLQLDRGPGDEAALNEVFRGFHTLKGSVGLFDFPAFTKLVHAGEDILTAVRSQDLVLTSDLVDRLLDALDQVSSWVDHLERSGEMPGDADGVSREMTAALRVCLPDPPAGGGDAPAPASRSSVLCVDAPWLATFAPEEREAALSGATASGSALIAFDYLPAEDCFFFGEDPFALVTGLPGLQCLSVTPVASWPAIGTLDPYRCHLRFRGLVLGPSDAVETAFRYVPDQVAMAPVPPGFLGGEATGEGAAPTVEPWAPMARRILGQQREVLAFALEEDGRAARIESVIRTVSGLLATGGHAARSRLWAERTSAASADAAAMTELLDDWLAADGAAAAAPPASGEAVPERAPDRSRPGQADGASQDLKPANRVLKVDQAKVDTLMALIGELVVSKNSLPFLARRAEDIYGSRDMSREIKDLYGVIDRLAQEMQGAIMAVRMLPVSEVFDRLPRLVRDLARRLDKRISLRIEGGDTAADKNMIEVLGDPLIHVIRNAIDHGIETPDLREQAGKPPEAVVRVAAFQENDQVVIEVSDDGRGIDPAKIREKAVAKGILDAERAARLTDQDAINLIFYPGFSTAPEVSDLSGRGVGMDIVVTTVEAAGGTVSVTSETGLGTRVRLSLPLSMAVTRVMLVEVGDTPYGIPMDHIVETVRVRRGAVRHIKQAEAFVLRQSIVPLVRLDRVLDLPDRRVADDPDHEEAVLVVRVAGSLLGLVVDHFREGMDIILKPLDGILSSVRGFAGTALLGDGRVLLVLNLKELL
ncbi:MAG: chemotaxis protein CheA [Telmatospirillum sp.]|nr:chemotaxis protein CheA [Telmatospirillum sp.]